MVRVKDTGRGGKVSKSSIRSKQLPTERRIRIYSRNSRYNEHANNEFNRYNEHNFGFPRVKILLCAMLVTN